MVINHTNDRRSLLIVLLLALLIHLFLSLIFFIADVTQSQSISRDTQHADTPIIFQPPPPEQSQPIQQQQEESQEWAAMTAGPSAFGIPDEEGGIGQEKEQPAQQESSDISDTSDTAEKIEEQSAQEMPLHTTMRAPTTLVELSSGHTEKVPPARAKEQKKAALRALPLTDEQKKAAQQLATLSRGYLDQIKTQGNNLVTLVGGDTSKLPTALQLQYVRYWAKLQWSLQNSLYANTDRYPSTKQLRCQMRVLCSVKRDGAIQELKILDSSGDNQFDTFIYYSFEQAASSFPPLPAFITQDPYPMVWIIQVEMKESPVRWGMR
jgi:outer membrane biosynthesis protein TonB